MKHIENIKLEAGDSGYKVTCTECKKPEGSSMYESMDYDYKEFLFSEKDSEAAFKKFKDLDNKMKNKVPEKEEEGE